MAKLKYGLSTGRLHELLAGGLLVVVTTASAQAVELSGNVTLATDYIYRGISQTDEEATVQGGFDLAADNGFYAGIWASNIAFDGSVEVDYYLGFSNDISDAIRYDFGLLHYDYPNQSAGQVDSNFDEVYGSGSFKDFTLGFAYSSDFFAETGSATYVYAEYDLALPNDFSLGFHYGSQSIDKAEEYDDYAISVSKELAGIELSLTWYDTDISNCAICDSRVVFGLSKSM